MEMLAVKSLHLPSSSRAWLGIAIRQGSPNLTRFHLTVADQIGKAFTVLKSLDVTVVLLSKSSICSGDTTM